MLFKTSQHNKNEHGDGPNTLTKGALGALGETAACERYKKQGFKIIAQNYKTRLGELDFVAQKGKLTVVGEVKLRKSGAQVSGATAVTPQKVRKILSAASSFLAQHNLFNSDIRFDVVEIEHLNGNIVAINCIENAFTA